MKKIFAIICLLGLLTVSVAQADTLKLLFWDLNIPLPRDMQAGFLSNAQVSFAKNVTLDKDMTCYTSEFLRQYDCLYIKYGYSSLNTWIFMPGIDILAGLNKFGVGLTTPIDGTLKALGIGKITIDFIFSIDPSNNNDKVYQYGYGTTPFDLRKK